MTKIYLAIPYSGYEEKSFKLANEVAGQYIKAGFIVFSPISMSHPIANAGDFKGDWETWSKIDLEFIKWCDTVVVVNFCNKAVSESIGVQSEVEFAKKLGKKVVNFYE